LKRQCQFSAVEQAVSGLKEYGGPWTVSVLGEQRTIESYFGWGSLISSGPVQGNKVKNMQIVTAAAIADKDIYFSPWISVTAKILLLPVCDNINTIIFPL